MKKIVALAVALLLACLSLPLVACDSDQDPLSVIESDNGSQGILYSEVGHDAYEVAGYCGNDTNVIIPAYHNYKQVVGIGCNAFRDLDIVSVSLPEGLTYIEDYSFADCYSLERVNIPNSVTDITCTSFGRWTNTGDTAPIFAENNWEGNALYIDDCLLCLRGDNQPIAEFTVKSGTRIIANNAFSTCMLQSLIIPDSVEIVGKFGFTTSLNYSMYLSKIKIGKGVKRLGALHGSGILLDPENWIDGKIVIDGCLIAASGDGDLVIGSDIRVIADGALSVSVYDKASNFSSISVDSANKNYYSKENCVIEKDTQRLVGCAANTKIADGVKILGTLSVGASSFEANKTDGVFYFPDGIEEVETNALIVTLNNKFSIGKNMKSMYYDFAANGSFVFRGEVADLCVMKLTGWWNSSTPQSPFFNDADFTLSGTALTNITVPSGIESLGMACAIPSVTEITLPDSVSIICPYALGKNIQTLNIGNGLKYIGSQNYFQPISIGTIDFSGTISDWCDKIIYPSNSYVTLTCDNLYIDGSLIKDLVISSDVSTIKQGAFAGISLNSVNIPANVQSIEHGAFLQTGLTSAVFESPDGWNDSSAILSDAALAAKRLSFVGFSEDVYVLPTALYKV